MIIDSAGLLKEIRYYASTECFSHNIGWHGRSHRVTFHWPMNLRDRFNFYCAGAYDPHTLRHNIITVLKEWLADNCSAYHIVDNHIHIKEVSDLVKFKLTFSTL